MLTRPAPAILCSCLCRAASTLTPCWSALIRLRTLTACTPLTWGAWCCGSAALLIRPCLALREAALSCWFVTVFPWPTRIFAWWVGGSPWGARLACCWVGARSMPRWISATRARVIWPATLAAQTSLLVPLVWPGLSLPIWSGLARWCWMWGSVAWLVLTVRPVSAGMWPTASTT